MQSRAGVLLVALSAVSFGSLALFARLALDNDVSRPTLLFLRFAAASLIMLAALRIQGIPLPSRAQVPKLMVLGAIYVGQAMCFFTALEHIATNMASLMLYLYPIFVTLMAWLFLKERLTAVKLFCLALALLGSALTIGTTGALALTGVLFGIGSAAFYSVYIVLGTRFLTGVNVIAASTVVMMTAATIFAAIAIFSGFELPARAEAWFGVAGLAVIATALAISAFFAGLSRVGPVAASTISALEPVVTAVLGAIFLAEALGALQVAGGLLILAATVILARASEPPLTSGGGAGGGGVSQYSRNSSSMKQ